MLVLAIYFLNLIANIILTFSYKKNLDPRSKSKTIKKLFFEFQELITICQQNLYPI